tara:strand:- start:6324 stop:6521 length:198 start_codon:yes stop_codon:yes gene_type:complete
VKPGDLVRIANWGNPQFKVDWNPLGLVLSEPLGNNEGTTSVLVDWLGSPDTEYYSAHHLEIISEA